VTWGGLAILAIRATPAILVIPAIPAILVTRVILPKSSHAVTGPAELPLDVVERVAEPAAPVGVEDSEDAEDAVLKDANGKKIVVPAKLTTRQRILGRSLIMAGGNPDYLTDISKVKALEKVIKSPNTDVVIAGKLAEAVRNGDVSEYLDYLMGDQPDDTALKYYVDRALLALKKMLKFGVSVDVFSDTRNAVKSYLEAKGHTFDDDEEDEDDEQSDEDVKKKKK